MSYEQLVKLLSEDAILTSWPDITPIDKISGVPRSQGSDSDASSDLFKGHDEEQIRLMEELCIVLDYEDKPIGAGTKKLCHVMSNINQGLLHRAFSVFLFKDGKLLLQQRADEKITFPQMWTNTCCSHPLAIPSELGVTNSSSDINSLDLAILGVKHAAQRKLEHELGIPANQVPIDKFNFLTRIHYKSGSNDEWGEHEIDYILIIDVDELTIDANYNEVKDYTWKSQQELKDMFEQEGLLFTPWFKLICNSFLYDWWNKLDNLEGFKDDKVHRLLE